MVPPFSYQNNFRIIYLQYIKERFANCCKPFFLKCVIIVCFSSQIALWYIIVEEVLNVVEINGIIKINWNILGGVGFAEVNL